MRHPGTAICALTFTFVLIISNSVFAWRQKPERTTPDQTSATPAYCNAAHNVGKIAFCVSNDGTFGLNASVSGQSRDCFTGEQLPTCEFPKGSRTTYLYAGDLWIGAVKGQDTLVSTGGYYGGNEFHPEESPLGDMIYRSTIDPAKPEFDGAISEQDFIAVYYDTCVSCAGTQDELDNREHVPLGIEVTQRSFAWSYAYAEDFVLFDYGIKNIGRDRLRRVYMGLFVDADVHTLAQTQGGYDDDLAGFKESLPALYLPPNCPPDSDKVNLAWTIDNDGGLTDNSYLPTPHAAALRIIRTPSDSLEVSFNWWIRGNTPELEFGPQARATYRDLGGGAQPRGDRHRYHFLSNGEFDYDQPMIGTISPLDPTWLPPPQDRVRDWARGLDVRFLISFGPFDIEPGQTLPISWAYLCGENFHTDPGNLDNLPDNPEEWYNNVDFSDLGTNATWASWVYDNPGVDTDNDGYAGDTTICYVSGDSALRIDTIYDNDSGDIVRIDSAWDYDVADTILRTGDGVPDFKGASPPPAPSIRVEPRVGAIKLVWDGTRSENTRDVFSRELDFEGYRVYFARDERRASYTVLSSYDLNDFNKYVWDANLAAFLLKESPFTPEALFNLYANGDSSWNPESFTRSHPFVMSGFSDSIFYFEPQDYNRSILANDPINANTDIRKTYPGAPHPPVLDTDSLAILFPNGGDSLYVDEYGFIKYYTYEYEIVDLLPTVPYWVNVTAFDYGSPTSGLAALETNPTLRPEVTYPLESTENVLAKDLDVFVYPNPYRLDANYRERGFEGRTRPDYPVERTRAIHFANVPPRCTIRIFSLDGDLVREFEHDVDPSDPLSNHASWDMITRNSQAVVSGLYYWTVEDDSGRTQIGKLVIIM